MPFEELLALHRVLLGHAGEMLRRERRDLLEFDLHGRITERIADREDAGIKDADDIAGEGFLDDLAVLRHELLRLRQADLALPLNVHDLHPFFEFAGTDTHESDPVTVRLVHVCLDLEHEMQRTAWTQGR